MNAEAFDAAYRGRLERLSTTNLADALDATGLRGAVIGIRPLFGMPKIAGLAATIKMTAAGMVKSKRHLGIDAIASASPGDIIAIDNRGDLYNNCWGEILSCAAQKRGVSGVVVDGAARDIDYCQEIGFPVFARGVVPITARGRIMQEDFNCPIRLGDVQVRPGRYHRCGRERNGRHPPGEARGSRLCRRRYPPEGGSDEGRHTCGHGHPGGRQQV